MTEPLAARFAAMRQPSASAATYTGASGALSVAAAPLTLAESEISHFLTVI